MSQIKEIKSMIFEMMVQEMENFKESVQNGDADNATSPVVYTMLQVLLEKIEKMPDVWKPVIEKADSSKYVVLYDPDGGYMSPPCRGLLGFDSMFIDAMNKKYGANYTMWAYMDDLKPKLPPNQDEREADKKKLMQALNGELAKDGLHLPTEED